MNIFVKTKNVYEVLKCKTNEFFFLSQTWGSQPGGGPRLGKIPNFFRFFLGQTSLIWQWFLKQNRCFQNLFSLFLIDGIIQVILLTNLCNASLSPNSHTCTDNVELLWVLIRILQILVVLCPELSEPWIATIDFSFPLQIHNYNDNSQDNVMRNLVSYFSAATILLSQWRHQLPGILLKSLQIF